MLINASFLGEWHAWAANTSIIVFVVMACPLILSAFQRRSSAALRHRVWCLAFCGALAVPVLTLILPQFRLSLAEKIDVQSANGDTLRLVEETNLLRTKSDTEHGQTADSLLRQAHVQNEQGVPITVLKRRVVREDTSAGIPKESSTLSLLSLKNGLVAIWAMGCFAFCVPVASAFFCKRRLLKNSQPLHDVDLRQNFAEMCRDQGVVRAIAIYESRDNVTPMTWGILRPVVIVPASHATWTSQRRHVVLLHELMHIKRLDYLFHWVAQIVSVLFWFNPLVWVGLHRLRRECERACDDEVVKSGEKASEYANELVDIAEFYASYPASLAIAMTRKSQLEDRIHSMFDRKRSHNSLTRFCEFGLISTALFLVCLTVILRPVDGGEAETVNAGDSLDVPRKTTDRLGDPLAVGSRFRFGSKRFSHPTIACQLALSPDEKTLVTAGYETMIVWDATTGRERWRANLRELGYRVPAASYGVRTIAFQGDSSVFYTPGKPDEFNVWNTEDGTRRTVKHESLIGRFLPRRGLISQARSIDVTRDGKKIALGSAQGLTLCDSNCKPLFTMKTKTLERRFQPLGKDRLEFGGHYTFARFSPDEKVLAMVTFESPKEIRIINAETGKERRRIALTDKMVRLDFSPDSRQIVATERDNSVRLYDIDTAESVWEHVVKLTHPIENYTSAVDFSPSGNMIAIGATDHRLYILDADSGDQIAKLEGHQWYPWAVKFNQEGDILYSTGWDGVIRRWDMTTMRQISLPGVIRATGVIATSPNGKLVAYADDMQTIHLADAENGEEIRAFERTGTKFSQLAFSADSSRLAGGGSTESTVRVSIWDLAREEVDLQLDWPKGRSPNASVEDLEFSPDDQRLAVAVFNQSQAYLFDSISGKKIAELPHREIYGLSFTADGKSLGTAGWDSMVRFWDTDAGALKNEFDVKKQKGAQVAKGKDGTGLENDLRMYTVCFSPHGDLFATAHMNQRVNVWNTHDLSHHATIKVEGLFRYGTMNFSPDGLWLATGIDGRDPLHTGEVTLWDPRTAEKVWDIGRHTGDVYVVGFGRDSQTLISGSEEGCCYVWDLNSPAVGGDSNDWADLQSSDSKTVFQAMQRMARAPGPTVKLLERQMKTDQWFSVDNEQDRRRMIQLVTSLLTTIRTPDAIRLLKRMSNSKQIPVQKAAENALVRLRRT